MKEAKGNKSEKSDQVSGPSKYPEIKKYKAEKRISVSYKCNIDVKETKATRMLKLSR